MSKRKNNKTKKLKIEIEAGHTVCLIVPIFWNQPIITCLCGKCASSYYNERNPRIRRADMDQYVTDTCDRCGCRHGYDYVIFEKNNTFAR